jgi:chorismate mutase
MGMVRGIRGATTVKHNDSSEILQATRELLEIIVSKNDIKPDDIISVLITVSPQLNATFPASAIRDNEDWKYVPLMCALEIPVPGALENCIRLLVHVNSDRSQKEIEHVYLHGAKSLRPDLAIQ